MPIISLQVSDELLERFEKTRIQSGFPSKSEGLRDAIVNFIENRENFEILEGYKVMTINLVYPNKESIIDEISELYSYYQGIIKTVTDWRIAEKKIEIILVVGDFNSIKDLFQKLARIKELIGSIHEIVID
jgi:CopG family nickel-responsive transcriptional regulator